MKRFVLGLVLGLGVTTGTAFASGLPTPKNADVSLTTDGLWIDVRSLDEYHQGHLQSAINLPFNEIGQNISRFSPDKNTPIHLYCQSGRRAAIAQKTLMDLGYTNVTNHGAYRDLINK